jgi:hypothetical protein
MFISRALKASAAVTAGIILVKNNSNNSTSGNSTFSSTVECQPAVEIGLKKKIFKLKLSLYIFSL